VEIDARLSVLRSDREREHFDIGMRLRARFSRSISRVADRGSNETTFPSARRARRKAVKNPIFAPMSQQTMPGPISFAATLFVTLVVFP